MLVILATHPIQYQVPLWQALSRDGRVPFEVWYLTHHGGIASHDKEFGKAFSWDIEMFEGYPHRLLKTPVGAIPTSFRGCRVVEPLGPALRRAGARAIWIQGWQVLGYWQAAYAAKGAGCSLWLRGESNDLAPVAWWKRRLKYVILSQLFSRVDRFLCIGSANKRLYHKFGVPEASLIPAPYAVDNQRFAAQAATLRPDRAALRQKWRIAAEAFCVLFCGKFISKKNPMDVIYAAQRAKSEVPDLHVLFVGSGELGVALRDASNIAFDAESSAADAMPGNARSSLPPTTFTGFINQTEISQAYVAADCLVLPSDYGETWGLVVNEAMASGLPCIISDHCGCAEDLGKIEPNALYPHGDIAQLANAMVSASQRSINENAFAETLAKFSFAQTIQSVVEAYKA